MEDASWFLLGPWIDVRPLEPGERLQGPQRQVRVDEQAPVGDNLWMPSASEQHIAARAFIFDGIRQDVHVKDFDFHKFNVDSLQEIKPPAPDAATSTQP